MADSKRDTVLADLEMTRALTIQLTLVGSLGFFLSLGAFAALFGAITGEAPRLAIEVVDAGWWNGAVSALLFLVLLTVVLVPHELLHGLAIRHYGGDARYGVGLSHFIMPYAYATTDHSFSRNQFLVVLLTPLVAITGVGVPLMLLTGWGWLVIPLAANAGGAVVDCWMATEMARFPDHAVIQDHKDGVRVLGYADDEVSGFSPTGWVWDVLSGAAAGSVGLLVLFGIPGPFVLSALGIESLTIGTPGTFTYLFSFSETATEISYGVGPATILLGTLAGVVYAFLKRR